ncbi:hypothetical protein [Methylobacterium sp. AMS5]|uniref:hypothetical protein n=1 Tax=Methylobacterium sp. AMS5 TaxID=925818 RepID=UPI00074FA2D0|nr:hypothetical protein [Methylobacterium sp. AMS5]AMB47685.1 hypothetical protein Y590_22285 [Methylobacterium sp. AMS5]
MGIRSWSRATAAKGWGGAWRWARRYDWRLWTLFLAILICLALTGLVYYVVGVPPPNDHWGSVFASWVGGVALFLVVGVASAITQVARPELESFDTRARILFRKQSGRHIDYIVGRVQQLLEHYADTTHRKVSINEFHDGEGKFLVAVQTAVSVRSYIDDVRSTYGSTIQFRKVTAPPPGRSNRLVFVRADGKSLGAGTDFTDAIERPFETTIEAGCPCLVESRVELWVAHGTEPNTYRPARYSQQVVLEIENNLHDGRGIVVTFHDADDRTHEVRIPSGESRVVIEATDAPPLEQVFDFRLSHA